MKSSKTVIRKSIRLVMVVAALATTISCSKEEKEAPLPTYVTDILNIAPSPANFSSQKTPSFLNKAEVASTDNTPSNNPITNEGARLGRVLFYDTKLSRNNTISCASCHQQAFGFSDPLTLSNGFEGGKTGRNSMGLANAAFYENGKFFWDERASSLEEQALMPIQDETEMGMTLQELEIKLQNEEYYKYLFAQAYGDSIVTSERIAKSIAQFIRSMVSYQSKFDKALAKHNGELTAETTLSGLSALENIGMSVFISEEKGNCASCHIPPTFSAPEATNIGLDVVYEDKGVGKTTGREEDIGKFKVPSLKNVALTAPYMHDGRFETLEQVVEHYQTEVKPQPFPDDRLKIRLHLSEEEVQGLVAFMNTLTDESLITDKKFSDPFYR